MAADIIYLLNLGVTMEEIAARAGRTVTAIQHELDTYHERKALEEASDAAQEKNVCSE